MEASYIRNLYRGSLLSFSIRIGNHVHRRAIFVMRARGVVDATASFLFLLSRNLLKRGFLSRKGRRFLVRNLQGSTFLISNVWSEPNP